jgi:hypothetical protein
VTYSIRSLLASLAKVMGGHTSEPDEPEIRFLYLILL